MHSLGFVRDGVGDTKRPTLPARLHIIIVRNFGPFFDIFSHRKHKTTTKLQCGKAEIIHC